MTTPNDPPRDDLIKEMALELNFVPDWARDHAPTVHIEARERAPHERDDRRGGRRGSRDQRGQRHRNDRGGQGGRGSRRDHRDGSRGGPRHQRPAPIRRAPVRVDFMPDRARLGKVVHLIRHSKRAYDVRDLAHRFMANPSLFVVKLQLHHRAMEEGERLFQYRFTKQIFLQREACVAHALREGLSHYFDPVATEVDPPTGRFPCVGRCRIGGELLGPPNHHSYARALGTLQAETYPDRSLDALRAQVEMVHDEEVIEQWRQQQTQQIRWRHKSESEAGADPDEAPSETEAPILERREAETWLRHHGERDIKALTRAMAPGSLVLHGQDERVVRAIETAAQAEQEDAQSMLRALRPALRHMGLTFFSAGKNRFVTAVPPEPLRGKAVQEIEQTIDYLRQHPGASREALLAYLSPGKTEKDDEVVHELSSLRWLIDKGHVIEFFDGSLALPAGDA